jgi:glycosyltransferase involved in cell wall biosynthesis
VGGLAFLVQDRETGYLVPVREPQSLAKSIQDIMNDCCKAEEMGQKASLVAREYAWPRIADKLLEIFDEILSKKQRQVV